MEAATNNEHVTTYSMHVSAKYLELTKKKLELTRLPRELNLPERAEWEQGTPKKVLEPLLDFWLDGYNWRAAEARFNLDLPQFRTLVTTPSILDLNKSESLKMHFIHKRSQHKNAIPLLFCHTWPSSFIEVQRILDALTDPQTLPGFRDGAGLAFHVIAPSIPGFGFSDASQCEQFGLHSTAEVFDRLMSQLGYDQYVAHGTGWGFDICRAIALRHAEHCLAVHTVNPSFDEPEYKRGAMSYMKYCLAKLTQAKLGCLSFGYLPTELQAVDRAAKAEASRRMTQSSASLQIPLHHLYSLRPQTMAFSLCDSPVGLLATLVDILHCRPPSQSPMTSRARSPFMSPVELERRGSSQDEDNQTRIRAGLLSSQDKSQPTLSPVQSETHARNYTWSPSEILNFTMLQWLPGPEAALRWLRRARIDTLHPLWRKYCPVPLGISSFRSRNSSSGVTPLMWGSATWDMAWIKRHQRPAVLPAWEQPDLLVLDLRECFSAFLSQGRLAAYSKPGS